MCQVDTLQKGPVKVPKYLRIKDSDFRDLFNPKKASELLELGGVKHAINIEGTVPYSPLYNLLEN
jgi:hypothetical protein